jgi:hypothetical protein
MDMVAASSPRSRVPENIRNASYYYGFLRRGEDIPTTGANPEPYGHIAQILHQNTAARVAREGWDPDRNPKPQSFVQNLIGNQLPGTIDSHATNLPAIIARDPRWLATDTNIPRPQGGFMRFYPRRLYDQGLMTLDQAVERPAFWAGRPRRTEYAALEQMYQDIARRRGLTTAGGQASAWIAGGRTTGLQSPAEPWMQTFEDAILRTAEARGQKPSQVLREFIRGKSPLLSIPGIAAYADQMLRASEEAPPEG